MHDKLEKKRKELEKIKEQKDKILEKEKSLIQEIRDLEIEELQKKLKSKNMSFEDLIQLISE